MTAADATPPHVPAITALLLAGGKALAVSKSLVKASGSCCRPISRSAL